MPLDCHSCGGSGCAPLDSPAYDAVPLDRLLDVGPLPCDDCGGAGTVPTRDEQVDADLDRDARVGIR